MNPMLPAPRTACLACGAPLGAPVFASDGFPASAQDMPDAEALKTDRGIRLELCRCSRCGLAQYNCEPVSYYRKVIRVLGLFPAMRARRRADFELLMEKYGLEGGSFLECGCGNGDFLTVLQEFPAEITGMEADLSLAEEAAGQLGGILLSGDGTPLSSDSRTVSGRVPRILNLFAETPETEIPGAPFDCFLSFNFLEHQPDPLSMLRCMHRNLREGGLGLITVPSFEYILEKRKYYELIRDHIANYSMESLSCLCRAAGFEILQKDFIGIGDTLRFVVKKRPDSLLPEAGELSGQLLSAQKVPFRTEAGGLSSGSVSVPAQRETVLAESHREISAHVSAFTAALKAEKKTLALWGAGHQCFTIASTTDLGKAASYIIDSSDKKQGYFSPVSHLPIISPEQALEHPTDIILIAVPSSVTEITEIIQNLFAGKTPEIRSILDF